MNANKRREHRQPVGQQMAGKGQHKIEYDRNSSHPMMPTLTLTAFSSPFGWLKIP